MAHEPNRTTAGDLDGYADLLARLGQHETGKGCLYLKRVDQADQQALREIVDRSFRAAAPWHCNGTSPARSPS